MNNFNKSLSSLNKIFSNFGVCFKEASIAFNNFQKQIKKEMKIKEIEKCYKQYELEEAKIWCRDNGIDYYTFLCAGCNKSIIVDMLISRLIKFIE